MKIHKLPILLFTLSLAASGCKHKDVIKPTRRDIVDAVFGSGHIENKNQYTVMSNVEGFVDKAFVVEGDTVHEGQKLFQLENNVQQTQVVNAAQNLTYAKQNAGEGSAQIAQLRIQIKQAKQRLSVDSTNYERYSRLVKTQAVAVSDFDNAKLNWQNSSSSVKQLEKNLADLQHTLNLNLDNAKANYEIQEANNGYNFLISRGSGAVMKVEKKSGDYIRKGDAVAILGTGDIIIKLDIAEADIDRVKTGQKTLISLNSQPDKTYNAVITKIYPSFDTTEQSFVAEAAFSNAIPHLLNGTQLQANIIVQTKPNVLVIPSNCIVNDEYVMLKGKKDKQKVSVGIRTLEWTEITGGLSENDVLVPTKKP